LPPPDAIHASRRRSRRARCNPAGSTACSRAGTPRASRRSSLARTPGELPRFALISLLEDDASACLSLVDQKGVRLNAICGLGEGRIQRMALFRPLPA
jgi:hypothetical protein